MLNVRRNLLVRRGLAPETAGRVLAALGRPLPDRCPDPDDVSFPHEAFVPDWIAIAVEAGCRGCLPALRRHVAELNFPIAAGVKHTPAYVRACLDPAASPDDWPRLPVDGGPAWEAPDLVSIHLHDTGTGVLPVIEASARADFLTLVRALGHRNEPVAIPDSMGANFLNGYVNRRRFFAAREAQAAGRLDPQPPDSALWKDRLLLLSSAPYSGASASCLGMSDAQWLGCSRTLRLHHESCHYFIRRLFPKLRFGIQDELVADFAGLVAATGAFQSRHFLAFMGLEDFPEYRQGGRLQNYHRGMEAFPDAVCAIRRLVVDAARNIESFFAGWSPEDFRRARLRILATLTFLPLELLADPDAATALDASLERKH